MKVVVAKEINDEEAFNLLQLLFEGTSHYVSYSSLSIGKEKATGRDRVRRVIGSIRKETYKIDEMERK